MAPQEAIRRLAEHVKKAVFPHLGTWRARKVTGIASSGDATFDIDDIAEAAVESFLRDHSLNVAYYSEDRGLVRPFPGREPEGLLIIDPIDGTRGAIAGLEACVVSVAWTDPLPEPALRDVRYAAITEIKGDLTITAARGEGVSMYDRHGNGIKPALLPTTEVSAMACALEVVGAPMEMLFDALKETVNATTVRGGCFILNSSAFELTRLVTGQLAAVIDVRNRLLREFPQTKPLFLRHGGGRLICLYGYDVAAAALIVQEAGGVVTDAWGRDLSAWTLMDTTESNFGSLIAASNSALHAKLVAGVDEGFARLKIAWSSSPRSYACGTRAQERD
ncbi:MAG TPA: inositol monophosphatase family protein [Chthonomonadaceae bacterium]|nr:inositol monophosphatase family protein [Chthonomonadaceae bacterium]